MILFAYLYYVLDLFYLLLYTISRTVNKIGKNPMTQTPAFLRDFLGMTILAWAGYALLVIT